MDLLVVLFGLISFWAFGAPLFCKPMSMPEGCSKETEQSINKVTRHLVSTQAELIVSLAATKNIFANLLRAVQTVEQFQVKSAIFLNCVFSDIRAVTQTRNSKRNEIQEHGRYKHRAMKKIGEAIECSVTAIAVTAIGRTLHPCIHLREDAGRNRKVTICFGVDYKYSN